MPHKFAIYPSLLDKTVFVTGGASGIGAEIVSAFSQQGAKVGFLDLDEGASQALCEKLGDRVQFELCDLREIDVLKSAMGKLVDRLGAVDVLVNNAARDDRHDWKDVTAEYWDERMSTNL